MIFVRRLQETERWELKQLARREVGRVSERIRMILLSSRGYPIPEIATIFECDEATVRSWIERFEAEGVAGLRDRPRSGRPRKADAVAREQIRFDLEQGPAKQGYLFGYWTLVTLSHHLVGRCGLILSRTTLRRTVLDLDFRWRRPRHDLPTDPAAATIMWQLCHQLLHLPTEAVVLALDECDVHLLPVLRAMWMPRGKQIRIPTPGSNRKRTVFGALDLASGRWLYQVTVRKRSIEFLAFLEHLIAACPECPLVLILDNASIHKAKCVQVWLTEHPQVQLLYLPAYSGHKHNPVEKVWWRLKDRIAADRLHGSIDALIEGVHEFFGSFTRDEALRLAA
jgi:transposase